MEKIFNKDHILIQAFYFLIACMIFVFETFTLLERGLSSSTIGLIFSLGQVLSMIFQYVVSNYLDHHPGISVFGAALNTTILMVILTIINLFLKVPNLLLIIINILILGTNESMTPLTNSFATSYQKLGYVVYFGVARAAGSLSFAIGSVVYGYLTTIYSYYVVTGSILMFSIILVFILWIANKNYKKECKNVVLEKTETIDTLTFIKNHKMFILLCLGYGLCIATATSSENFQLQIVERIGGSSADNGYMQGLRALCEVPVIFFFDKIEKKFSMKTILYVAAISYVVKIAALSSDSLIILYLAQFLQMITFSLLLPGLVSYTGQIMNEKEMARGFAMQTVGSTFVAICMNGLAGIIIDTYGVLSFCHLCFFTELLGAIIVIFSITYLENRRKKNAL